MLKIGRHVLAAAFLLVLSLPRAGLADPVLTDSNVAVPDVANSALTPLPTVSTCRSRTINYITHTLPQQCLRARSTTPPGSNSTAPAATESAATSSSSPTGFEGNSESHSSINATRKVENTARNDSASSTASAAAVEDTPSTASHAASPTFEPEAEADSPLDTANFLSFEEWKKQNLAKAGQSPDNVGQGRGAAGSQNRKHRPVNLNSELDFLGEDAEIELDFGGFGANKAGQETDVSSGLEAKAVRADGTAKEVPANGRPRSKDAGKTCKERFNYASFDCAATVLKTNSQCKSSSSLLVENKDSYMLNECAADNKFVIVELCDDILVDTIVLANFEFFSSMFRTFRVSVSDRYPVKLDRWKELGIFEARNSRDIQAFLVENPLIWARYLRIEFLSYYGNEFYCPVSLLRVHGTTMMEEFRHQEEAARGDDDSEEIMESEGEAIKAISSSFQASGPTQTPVADEANPSPHAAQPSNTTSAEEGTQAGEKASSSTQASGQTTSHGVTQSEGEGVAVTKDGQERQTTQTATANTSIASETHYLPVANTSSLDGAGASSTASNHTESGSASSPIGPTSTSTGPIVGATDANHASEGAAPSPEGATNGTDVASAPSKTGQTSGETARHTATQPQNAAPTTQESFFKSIHKRLQMLESNSTLSLQYIEDQSRILRDAFAKVERRQLGKTEKFLEHLNSTVMAELREFRQQYDQLWQSTVIELENRREQHQREMLAISTRLTLLADELLFQKRMAVVQSTLILLCLGLVLFVRSGSNYLELPLVQQMMHKLQFDSPASSPSPQRYRRHGPAREERSKQFGNMSDASVDERRSPLLEFSPPTPTSEDDDGAGQGSSNGGFEDSPPGPVRKTQSSPSTPQGSRDGQMDWSGSEAEARGEADTMRRVGAGRSGTGDGRDISGAVVADPNQHGDSGGSATDSDEG
ncbi:UNC-like C-terminal-domain-containing protein [Phyllosticta citribraziliensis]|uniref:UNC-like C-terminal-domain-containing protein n=1 Tax=Phyllosticta citribraziliensis TaxID=989973 RepID=A0ABR1LI33_9PEZI